jgi:hypothetical protein
MALMRVCGDGWRTRAPTQCPLFCFMQVRSAQALDSKTGHKAVPPGRLQVLCMHSGAMKQECISEGACLRGPIEGACLRGPIVVTG